MFWKQLPFNPPLYGADVEGSLFDEACACWNVSRLGTRLTTTLAATTPPARIPGVTSPYLYWGSWRAMFAWHTEGARGATGKAGGGAGLVIATSITLHVCVFSPPPFFQTWTCTASTTCTTARPRRGTAWRPG